MKYLITALLACLPNLASADSVVAARTIRSQAILTPEDLQLVSQNIPGAAQDIEMLIGQETRGLLYAGRPIRIQDVAPPALLERNQIVTLYYQMGTLKIAAEGRTLARAAVGDRIRVMNLASRSIITGTVTPTGTISVSPTEIPSM